MQQHLSNELVLLRLFPATTCASCHIWGPNLTRSLGDVAFNEVAGGWTLTVPWLLHPSVQPGTGYEVQVSFAQQPKGRAIKPCLFLPHHRGVIQQPGKKSKRPFKKPCRFCWIKDQGGWSQQLYYLWKWKITLYTIVTTICAPSLHSSGSYCSSAHTSNHVAAGMRASTGQSPLLPHAHIICIFRTPFADPGAAKSLPTVCSSHVCWF